MTNFEKYKEQLLSFDYVEGNTPAKKSGKLMRCADTHCTECDFINGNCTTNFIEWLYENDDKAECCENCAHFDTSTVRGNTCEVCNRNYSNQFKPKPKKTRQDEFLEHYPDANVYGIQPCNIENENFINEYCAKHDYCLDCVNDYWAQEVKK